VRLATPGRLQETKRRQQLPDVLNEPDKVAPAVPGAAASSAPCRCCFQMALAAARRPPHGADDFDMSDLSPDLPHIHGGPATEGSTRCRGGWLASANPHSTPAPQSSLRYSMVTSSSSLS
jgi:hypothetical protein